MELANGRSYCLAPCLALVPVAGLVLMCWPALADGEHDLSLASGVSAERAAASAALPAFGYTSRTWQSDEGLPNNYVRALVQTPDGYLWVGTCAGLARFDGLRFTSFNSGNTPALESDNITALCVDRAGTLWIGTFGGGLVCLRGGVFAQLGPTNGLAGDQLSALCLDPDGSLWIGTTTGLSRYKDNRLTNYTRKEGLLSEVVRCICEDHGGNLWIATGEGLNQLKGGVLSAYTRTNGLPDNSVRGLWEDRRGRLWIGSDTGMTCYDQGKFTTYGSAEGLTGGFVQTVYEDRQGRLWVGTYSGIYHFREGRFFPELNGEGVPYDLITALFEDEEGDVWAGSREGLIRLTPKRFFTYARRQGLTHDNVMSVIEDRANNLWIGTWGGGLNRLTDGKVTAYTTRNGFPHDLILSLCEGRNGSLWVGADYDGGITRLKDGKLTHYTWRDGLLNAAVRVLHEDRGGNLWIGTSKGLSCLREGKFIQGIPQQRLAGRIVRAICEDHEGCLWFGTETGLGCWKDGQFTNFTVKDALSSSAVLSLHEDVDHDLWIGTWGGGLNRWRKGKFSCYTTKQGLFSDYLLAIVEDDCGYLWMSCPQGLSRVRKAALVALDEKKSDTVHAVSYGRLDGLMSVLFNGVAQPAAWKGRDGRLWFPTTKGLLAVDADIPVNEAPPPVVIEQVVVDRRPIALAAVSRPASASARPPPAPAAAEGALRVMREHGELEFDFTALSLQLPEKNRFKYKLVGVDEDWNDAGTRRAAYYHSVAAGSYRFLVTACNNDGVWNEAPAPLALELLPHFWQTIWFRGLVGLGLTGGLAGSVRYVSVRKLRRKLALVEREHAVERERARIAKDIHDDLGSSLTRIAMLSELAKADIANPAEAETHAGKIAALASAAVESLDEIVWAVSPENDTWNSLAEYLSRYASEFFEGTHVRCRLEMPLDLPAGPLSADVRHNLFLVIKEALNNILKHAGASHAYLRLSANNAGVELTIADDGCGFDPERATDGLRGNGLANMRQRLATLGGVCCIESRPGQGTKLTLTLPRNAGRRESARN